LAAPYLVPTRLHITRHFFWIGGFYEIIWQEAAVFVIMIVVLFVRPDGLFKRRGMRVG